MLQPVFIIIFVQQELYHLLEENRTWHKVLKHFIKTLNFMK